MKLKLKFNNRLMQAWPGLKCLFKLVGVVTLYMGLQGHANACVGVTLQLTAPASVDISPTVPVGDVIGTMTLNYSRTSESGCRPMPVYQQSYTVRYFGQGTPNGNVYPTSLSGVGYRVKLIVPGSSAPINNVWFPVTYSDTWNVSTQTAPAYSVPAGYLSIELVKTGSILPGVIQPQVFAHSTTGTYNYIDYVLSIPIPVAPVTPACTVTSSAIPVNLDPVAAGAFQTAGQTAGDKAFTIPLNCSSSVNISLAFSGTMQNTANAVFKNTNSVTGTSVGIQLLDKNNNPVPTTAGQYVAVGTVNGSLGYPMTARYYALSSTVQTGDVNAIAFATIVYN